MSNVLCHIVGLDWTPEMLGGFQSTIMDMY